MSLVPHRSEPALPSAPATAQTSAPVPSLAASRPGALGPLLALALAAVLAVAGCSGSSGGSQPVVSVDPNAPALLAHGLKFDKDELDVPSGQAFDLVLNNEDGVPHNIAIYADDGHTQVIFRGDLESTGIHVYHVPAIVPGTYYFQCDVHPAMNGIVVVGQG